MVNLWNYRIHLTDYGLHISIMEKKNRPCHILPSQKEHDHMPPKIATIISKRFFCFIHLSEPIKSHFYFQTLYIRNLPSMSNNISCLVIKFHAHFLNDAKFNSRNQINVNKTGFIFLFSLKLFSK